VKLPLRLRLAAAYCCAFLVLVGAVELGAYFSVRAAIRSLVDHELATRLAGLDDHLTRHIGLYTWPRLAASLRLHPAFDPNLLLIRRTGGELLLQGRSFDGVRISGYRGKPSFETVDGPAHVLRVLSVRRTILGQSYDLALGTDLLISSAILRRLWLLMLFSLPAVLLAASATGYWIAGRALAPVSGIIAAARSIDSTRLSERIAVPATRDEIEQLAETVNGMLARIEAGVMQMRQFTADASHELRTPLAIIRARAEVALLSPLSNQRSQREALRRILREAERNSALLEDLLHLARSDSGSDRARPERINLNASIAQACTAVTPLAVSKGLRVTFPAACRQCFIEGDQDHLQRLWLILLDNAIKFTPEGGTISILVGEFEGSPFFKVADSGVGIPPEHLPRIFDRFYRVDKARSRREGGTGLGLSIALEIAKLHDAKIEVESEPGRGSTFRVVFPRTSAPRVIARTTVMHA
jgi:heavy metal sensor kinase